MIRTKIDEAMGDACLRPGQFDPSVALVICTYVPYCLEESERCCVHRGNSWKMDALSLLPDIQVGIKPELCSINSRSTIHCSHIVGLNAKQDAYYERAHCASDLAIGRNTLRAVVVLNIPNVRILQLTQFYGNTQ